MKALCGTRLCPTQDWRFWLMGALCRSRNIKDRNLVPNIEEGATGEVRLFQGRNVYLSGVYKRNREKEEMKQ